MMALESSGMRRPLGDKEIQKITRTELRRRVKGAAAEDSDRNAGIASGLNLVFAKEESGRKSGRGRRKRDGC